MVISPGTRLGPYEITASIGAGGMGQVYKAIDTRLDRVVAIKVSATEFSERFEREARAVAALNHPNICQLYDVGPNYLVMEYVEGQPAGRVESMRKLLDLAVQMADAMAAAHAAGIVHRDLKPDNILVTADGRAKILDFGLAKAAGTVADHDDRTRTAGLTDPGTTLGTVAYMSPEQARGEVNLGPPSDQFSLGLVLYEMVTGRRAFRRDSTAETMTAIIREDAEPLPSSAPAPLRWVVERLLSKDPADRYESSRDLYRELRHIRERLSQSTPASAVDTPAAAAPRAPRRRLVLGLVLGAAGLAAGTGLGLGLPFARSRSAAPPDLSAYRFSPISVETPTEREPAWAPDGTRIAYVASINGVQQVMTRAIGGAQAAQLTRRTRNATLPFWSADGSTIYFVSMADDGQSEWLWAVSAAGGTPEPIMQGVVSAAAHPDGRTFAFTRDTSLWIGSDPRTGGEQPRELATFPPNERVPVVRGFSPDGSRLAALGTTGLRVYDYRSGEVRHFPIEANEVSWMPDSRRLVFNTTDGATSVLSMLDTATGATRTFYATSAALSGAAVSPDGRRIAFMGGDSTWQLFEIRIADGQVKEMPSAGGVSWWPAWAPSGTHYAFVADKLERASVRDISTEGGGAFSRVLAEVDDGSPSYVEWAPDGNRYTFTLNRRQSLVLMLGNAAGSPPQLVDPGADRSWMGVWSPDGQWLAYARQKDSEVQLVKVRPGSTSQPEVLRTWPITGAAGAARLPVNWSSDGQWILTVRNRPGFFVVSPDGKTERQISERSASVGRPTLGFSRDGRAVLQLERNTSGTGAPWRLWSTDVATGTERVIADVPLPETAGDATGFSLHPDGTRFLTSVANWPFDIWMIEGFD